MNCLKKHSSNTKLIILLLGVLAIILVTSFVVTLVKDDDGGRTTQTAETEDGTVVFATPVGEFNYPQERAQYAKIKEKTNGTSYSGTLYGEVGKKEFKLFSIYINEQVADSFLLGTVTDDSGQIYSINVEIEDLETDDSWKYTDDKDKDLIYAMQEDVNYIVEQIGALSGFTPAY